MLMMMSGNSKCRVLERDRDDGGDGWSEGVVVVIIHREN
jgi:hypothetical protein